MQETAQAPVPTLLDLYTIQQSMPLDGIDVGLIGDLRYGRTAHSLAYALSLYRIRIHVITPPGLELPPALIMELRKRGTKVVEHEDVGEIIRSWMYCMLHASSGSVFLIQPRTSMLPQVTA